MLVPGSITVLVGDAGSTKSLFAMEVAAHLHEQGVPVDLFALEDDRAYHGLRALVQRCGESGLLDDQWCRDNGTAARELFRQHEPFMRKFARHIHESPAEAVTYDAALDWLRTRTEAGTQVAIIDPITMLSGSDKPWRDDLNFITEVRKQLRKTGARLLIVTHPRKGAGAKGTSPLDDLAGGTAYARFSDTVLAIERHDTEKSVNIATSFGGTHTENVNRIVRIRKARKGRGGGCAIGMNFDNRALTFTEVGLIVN